MTEQLTPYEKEYLQNLSERTTKGTMAVSQYLQTFSANTTLGFPLTFTSDLTGSASIVNPTQNLPWVGLRTTTASGDKTIYQSKFYQRYWAYRTHRVTWASDFHAQEANLIQRAGMFDDNDGWFFQFDSNGLHCVVRSATSGSPVDSVVSIGDFNLDNLNGDGPSGLRQGAGKDLLLDRALTWGITYNWYGTQIVKFFITYGGSVVPLHEFIFSGQNDGVPFTRTAQLPIRFEIENTDTISGTATMRVGSVSHSVADDVSDDVYYEFSASSGTTPISVTSTTVWQDLIAVRPKATVNSIQNRGLLSLDHWQLLAESNSIEYRIIDNVTYTGGTWVSAGDQSISEYSVAPGTQVGTPRVIDINYLYSGRTDGAETPENGVQADIKLSLDTLSGAQYCYVIQARKLSATDASVYAAVNWREEY